MTDLEQNVLIYNKETTSKGGGSRFFGFFDDWTAKLLVSLITKLSVARLNMFLYNEEFRYFLTAVQLLVS